MPEPGLGLRFKITIDGQDLGNWQKCDGLSFEFDIYEYKEGGENGFVHRLPGRVKFQNIKLTRPVDKNSFKINLWLQSMQARMIPGTAEIAVLDASGESVAEWHLAGVYPVRWSGPSLDVNTSSIASETLELSHNGFVGL
jgi:phage tail-like protein